MRLLRADRGISMIETAIVLPVLIYLMIAVVQVGMFINAKLVVSEAARESARQYVIHAKEEEMIPEAIERAKARAQDVIRSIPYAGVFDVDDLRYFEIHADHPMKATVSVSYDVPIILPGMDRLVSESAGYTENTFLISGRATFHKEEYDGPEED
jgi:Flp pilus assembly protein TadG